MKYKVAELILNISGEILSAAVKKIKGFETFLMEESDPCFNNADDVKYIFIGEEDMPQRGELLYTCRTDEGTVNRFYNTPDGYFFESVSRLGNYSSQKESTTYLWNSFGCNDVYICGNINPFELKFALWIGFGLVALKHSVAAIHSSCIVCKDKAVLFLGESGTGKSTHTRLWRECIPGAFLLNDDSPIIRIKEGKPYVYGTPWSGKTHCYRQECYPLAACVRLSQAPHNKISKLPIVSAYGAIHPSFAPDFAYSNQLYNMVSEIIGAVLANVPCYHLECLPNTQAAQLSYKHCINE